MILREVIKSFAWRCIIKEWILKIIENAIFVLLLNAVSDFKFYMAYEFGLFKKK